MTTPKEQLDLFATVAMHALLSGPKLSDTDLAERSYEIALAMMERRRALEDASASASASFFESKKPVK